MTQINTRQRVAHYAEGTDHINVSVYAETDMGKIASPDWRRTFFVPHVGDFITPRSFANWMASGGDEELRHSTNYYRPGISLTDFRLLLLFAKYYQLCGMRSNLMSAQKLVSLPWVMYKKHIGGVREFDRWDTYPGDVKDMVKYIIKNGSKNHYCWKDVNPEVIDCFDHYMQKITGGDFIPFEQLNALARERSNERTTTDTIKSYFNGEISGDKQDSEGVDQEFTPYADNTVEEGVTEPVATNAADNTEQPAQETNPVN